MSREPKSALARKFQKLTTRARALSGSSNHAHYSSEPPSPVDYFSSEPDIRSTQSTRSRSGSQMAPLTPITPTGMPGTVGYGSTDLSSISSAPPLLEADQFCQQCHTRSESFNLPACTCMSVNESEPIDDTEEIADEMAQKILHQVVSQSEQGWTI